MSNAAVKLSTRYRVYNGLNYKTTHSLYINKTQKKVGDSHRVRKDQVSATKSKEISSSPNVRITYYKKDTHKHAQNT